MVTYIQNLCSVFNPSIVHTHSREQHTHTQCAAIYAAVSGEQLRVRCLAQGHLSRGIEGEASAGHSLPPTDNPCRPETRTQPFDYESDSLTIGPRLPQHNYDIKKYCKNCTLTLQSAFLKVC